MHEAYSHELIAAGFWLGSEELPQAEFYSYSMPPPAGLADATIRPESAQWVAARGEFILPYEAVRTASDPAATLMSFLREHVRRFRGPRQMGPGGSSRVRPRCNCVIVP